MPRRALADLKGPPPGWPEEIRTRQSLNWQISCMILELIAGPRDSRFYISCLDEDRADSGPEKREKIPVSVGKNSQA